MRVKIQFEEKDYVVQISGVESISLEHIESCVMGHFYRALIAFHRNQTDIYAQNWSLKMKLNDMISELPHANPVRERIIEMLKEAD